MGEFEFRNMTGLLRRGVAVALPALLFMTPALRAGEVLNINSPWRMHYALRNSVVYREANGEVSASSTILAMMPPEWTQADYDDQGWMRHHGPFFPGARSPGGHGQGENARLAHLQARARFMAHDPAQVSALVLSLSYRGGVIVFLNGVEVKRVDIPDGALSETTLAADYELAATDTNPSDDAAAALAQARLAKNK